MSTLAQVRRQKKAFLDHFRVHGNVTAAARVAGVERTNAYRWQEHDDQFAAAYREAEIEATETLEAEARRRAVEGVEKETGVYHRGQLIATQTEITYSDTLLIFLLKARAPEKYRERFDHRLQGGIEVRFPLASVREALGIRLEAEAGAD